MKLTIPKTVTPASMRAAYSFLRRISFQGIKLPAASKVRFVARKLRTNHGTYGYPDHIITIDTATHNTTQMLQIMAHEMIHAALEQNACSDHDKHDDHFMALARIIEVEMGWPKGSV